jgi:hypothetical protein
MLVEGTTLEVITGNKMNTYHYAETFILPASVGNYRVRYTGEGMAFLIVAYVKEDHCLGN